MCFLLDIAGETGDDELEPVVHQFGQRLFCPLIADTLCLSGGRSRVLYALGSM